MAFRFASFALALLFGAAAAVTPALAQDKSIVVASTTSTQDSGLFGHLLPLFKAKTGIDAKVIAQGTGQALDTGRRGDADVVFVHAKAQEEKFVAEGFGVKRFDVMYNDFVLIGPKSDPAGVKGKDIETALKAIQAKSAPFVSRGDKSGTHSAELALWKQAGIDMATAKGPWYREIGQGMGAALNTAGAMNGYVLSDRGTWLSFKNRGDLEISRRRRQAAVQSIRRHAREPRKIPEREEGIRPGLRRLAGLRRRPGRDRRLQDRRPAAVLFQRGEEGELSGDPATPAGDQAAHRFGGAVDPRTIKVGSSTMRWGRAAVFAIWSSSRRAAWLPIFRWAIRTVVSGGDSMST